MRKNIGWQEIQDGLKYRIRVIFGGDGGILWRRLHHRSEDWEPFDPTPEHWTLLLEKVYNRYVRRQAPYKEVERVIACARAEGVSLQLPTQ